MVWRLCVLVAWVAVVVAIGNLDGDAFLVVAAVLTVAAGALVNRLWALLAPLCFTLAYLAYASVRPCVSCGDHGDAGALAAVIFTGPAILALGVGVAARRFLRFMRNMETGADAEPPQAPRRSPPPGPVAP